MRLILCVVAACLGTAAVAAPRTIDDCEAIKDANAYNLCLASFGPTRGARAGTYPMATEGGAQRGAAATRGRSHRPPRAFGSRLSYARHGRVRMEFSPAGR